RAMASSPTGGTAEPGRAFELQAQADCDSVGNDRYVRTCVDLAGQHSGAFSGLMVHKDDTCHGARRGHPRIIRAPYPHSSIPIGVSKMIGLRLTGMIRNGTLPSFCRARSTKTMSSGSWS